MNNRHYSAAGVVVSAMIVLISLVLALGLPETGSLELAVALLVASGVFLGLLAQFVRQLWQRGRSLSHPQSEWPKVEYLDPTGDKRKSAAGLAADHDGSPQSVEVLSPLDALHEPEPFTDDAEPAAAERLEMMPADEAPARKPLYTIGADGELTPVTDDMLDDLDLQRRGGENAPAP